MRSGPCYDPYESLPQPPLQQVDKYRSVNALAESTIGQIKAELIHRRGPCRTVEQLEYALFVYIDWWNHRRLHGEISMRTPAEAEAAYYAQPAPLTEAGTQ